jgi:hypothetical protein
MKISDYFCFTELLTIQSIKMELRKSRNEDWMLIMIRVIPGHSTVLRQSIGFGQVEVQHFPPVDQSTNPGPTQDFETRDGLLALSGLRRYHKNVTSGVQPF